jgi:hypothetical protein
MPPLVLTTPTNPGKASFAPLGSVSITPYLVGKDPDLAYTTIQSAIDAAVADGHEDVDNPALILVRPGRYVESVFLRRGVYVQGLPDVLGGATVVGVVTCDLTDSGMGIDKNVTRLGGIEIEAVGGIGLHFTGVVGQQLLASQLFIRGLVGGQPIVVDNTGVLVTRSACIIGVLRIIGSVGALAPLIEVTAGQLLLDDFVDQLDDQSMVCLQTAGVGNVAISTGLLQGGVRLEGVSPDPDVLGQCIITSAPPREALFLGPGNAKIMANVQLLGGVSPNVVGTGVLVLGGNLTFSIGGSGFDPALTVVHPPSLEPDTYYLPGSAPATAAWAGVPVTQEEAIDRLAIQVAVLGGPIP